MKTLKTINIFTENLYQNWKVNEQDIIQKTKQLINYYLENLEEKSCLKEQKFNSLTLDIVFCDSKKTHELNREYREKDKPADIITFAIFADDENHFIFDGDINLGEIVIALDKVEEGVNRDISNSKNKEQELFFLISHGLMHLLGFDHQSEEDYNFVIENQKSALESIGYDKI